jgi:hypothetical protein
MDTVLAMADRGVGRMTGEVDRRANAACQAYYWAQFASDNREVDRAREAARGQAPTEWERWAARVPLEVTTQQAIGLAQMWASVAAVQ